MSDRIVPEEAYDETHPEHHEWYLRTGRCSAGHDHFEWTLIEAMKRPVDG